MLSLRDLLFPVRFALWVGKKARDIVLQERAQKETAFRERIAIWHGRVGDAKTAGETARARQGLQEAEDEYLKYLEVTVLQLTKKVLEEGARAITATPDVLRLPSPNQDRLARAANISEALHAAKVAQDHFLRGNAYSESRNWKSALGAYDAALALSPDNVFTLHNRGRALDQLERYEEALTDIGRALELSPNDPDVLNAHGISSSHLGRYDEALADYDRVIELAPDHPRPIYNRACLFSLAGRLDESLEQLKDAVARNELYRSMAREDKDLDNLRLDATLGPEFEKVVSNS